MPAFRTPCSLVRRCSPPLLSLFRLFFPPPLLPPATLNSHSLSHPLPLSLLRPPTSQRDQLEKHQQRVSMLERELAELVCARERLAGEGKSRQRAKQKDEMERHEGYLQYEVSSTWLSARDEEHVVSSTKSAARR